MSKHILDRKRRRDGAQVSGFASVLRRTGAEGSHPAAQYVLRRSKGPRNDALRAMAFMRIDRGITT